MSTNKTPSPEEIIIRKAMATVEVCYHSMRAASQVGDYRLQEAMQACLMLLRAWNRKEGDEDFSRETYSDEAMKVREAAREEMRIWKWEGEK